MKKYTQEIQTNLLQISLADFMDMFNKNMPASFPRATTVLLQKFKASHETLFKNGELWSLDVHRKKLIDWLPRNSK